MSTTHSQSQSQGPEDIEALRAELAASIDELLTRVNPKNVASQATNTVKLAGVDAATFLSGGGLPKQPEGTRARNAKIVLGVAAGIIAVIGLTLMSRKRG